MEPACRRLTTFVVIHPAVQPGVTPRIFAVTRNEAPGRAPLGCLDPPAPLLDASGARFQLANVARNFREIIAELVIAV